MEKEIPIPPKARILQASFAAFNQKGFHAVSMDEIAKQLRISKKTIYKYFGSKEELLEASLVEVFAKIEGRLNGLARQKSPKELLAGYFDVFKAWRLSHSEALKTELAAELPYLAGRIDNFERQTLLRHLIGTLKDLRSEGVIDYPSPSREFAMAFYQLMGGLVQVHEEHAEYLLLNLFKGMVGKRKKKEK